MFKDDRFISILSGVVLMIAIGTVVQRGGPLVEYFTGEAPDPVLNGDQAELTAGQLARIDVLRNDDNLSSDAFDNLVIAAPPACGKVFVQGGAIQYLPEQRCVGRQEIGYAVSGDDDRPVGRVSVLVRAGRIAEGASPLPAPRPADLDAPAVAAAPEAPAPPALPGTAPLGTPGLAAVAGHRDTPLAFLAKPRPGDLLALETPGGGVQRYRVTRALVVDSREWRFPVAPEGPRRLALATCW
ncbi:sortase domain-containing protein, partial [Paralimibaculum aggregatum]|uniref:sortase domain-containing protein n=1 Tax=Paralimibaculum aggregatum TaxID=3036245 RepID=UPI002553C107